jgi:integrase/recombinase XerC
MNQPVVAAGEDIDKMLAACRKGQRLGLLLVADAGLRETEVRSLTWDKVNLEEGSLTVHGKGNKQRAIAIVTERLRAALTEKKLDTGYVVPGQGGKKMARGVLSKRLGRISDRVLHRHLPAHSFRHGFAVRAVEARVPIKNLQLAMGHQQVSTTELYLRGLKPSIPAQHQAFAGFV